MEFDFTCSSIHPISILHNIQCTSLIIIQYINEVDHEGNNLVNLETNKPLISGKYVQAKWRANSNLLFLDLPSTLDRLETTGGHLFLVTYVW